MITRKRKIGILLTVCLLTVGIASVYAQDGKPLGGLDELWDAIFDIQATLDLQGQIAVLEYAVDELTAEVALLKMTPLYGPQGATGLQGDTGEQGPQGETGEQGPAGPSSFGELVYVSGWQYLIVPMPGDPMWICNLDDPNVFVYMLGKNELLNLPAHQIPDDMAYWEIDGNNILFVYPDPEVIPYFTEISVYVWQLPSPPVIP